MTTNVFRDQARLAPHAHASPETPTDRSDPARQPLIQDLAVAAHRLGVARAPFSIDVHLATIEHCEGINHHVTASRSDLMAEIGRYCRDWWHEIDDQRVPAVIDDEEVARIYFEKRSEEHLTTDRIALEIQYPTTTPADVETGRYCVLSTAHLSPGTASLLDEWCAEKAQHRPLAIADTPYGWFVPTSEPDPATGNVLPEDLAAAIDFAHEHGFEHILFDRDVSEIRALACYDW